MPKKTFIMLRFQGRLADRDMRELNQSLATLNSYLIDANFIEGPSGFLLPVVYADEIELRICIPEHETSDKER